MKQKIAFLSGCTGMDGSHLADFLLEKDYKIYGLIRRNSTKALWRIEHILDRIELVQGDMLDAGSLAKAIKLIKPDEIYNLAAQSFVKYSFEAPVNTADVTGLGALRLIEAVRENHPSAKVFQASSSEMFGKVKETPQTETTPFYPRSPYGCAKCFAHRVMVNYREAYNTEGKDLKRFGGVPMFISCGISFNHESIPKNYPILIKNEKNFIDVSPIEDMFKAGEKHRYEGLLDKYKTCHVWDGDKWTKIINGTRYQDEKKELKCIQTRRSCYEATLNHRTLYANGFEIQTQDVSAGDKVQEVKYPEYIDFFEFDINLARIIGFIVGDGYINKNGQNLRITGTDLALLQYYAEMLHKQFGWEFRIYNKGKGHYQNCKKDIYSIDFNLDSDFGKWLHKNIYTKGSSEKKVPFFILNGNRSIKQSFFDGYYDADGRQKGNERYKYKGWTTSSATLSLGLSLLVKELFNVEAKVKLDFKNGRRYYYCQLRNPDKEALHTQKDLNEVIKTYQTKNDDGWFFDIQTESGWFCTGPSLFIVHNSERRGEEFVSRKITKQVAKMKRELFTHGEIRSKLTLGNLEAKRDFGYAPDYVEGFWKTLQQDTPDDYVFATGMTNSIENLVATAFRCIGIVDWQEYVVQDERFMRPAEVDYLRGDATKAHDKLNWWATTGFAELVKKMVEAEV